MKIMNASNRINLIIGFVLIIIIFFVWIDGGKKYKKIEERGVGLIAKFTQVIEYPKRNTYVFNFNFNKEKVSIKKEKVPKDFSSNVGKFYRIKYLEEYPDLIIVKFDQEVTDTTEILKAGFRKEDIISSSYQE